MSINVWGVDNTPHSYCQNEFPVGRRTPTYLVRKSVNLSRELVLTDASTGNLGYDSVSPVSNDYHGEIKSNVVFLNSITWPLSIVRDLQV